MARKRVPLSKTVVLVLTLIFITSVITSCSSNSKLSNMSETKGSTSANTYNTRAEGAGAAPAADARAQGATMGMAIPTKALPIGTVNEEDVKIKKDQAVEIAKTMLDDPSAYVEGNAFLNPMYGIYGPSGACWTIDFTDKNSKNSNVNVTIDANSGEITGFNYWNADGQQGGKESITREEALAIATEILKDKFNINIGDYEIQNENMPVYDLKMPEMTGPTVYSFNYTRVVNGVLFPFETISISIDGVSGQLRGYYRNDSQFDFSSLPSKDGSISPQQALEQYRNAVKMSLQYITLYKDKPSAVLVYAPTDYIGMMDAFTGKPLNYDGLPYNLSTGTFGEISPMSPGIAIGTKDISEKDAEVLAEKYKKSAENLYGIKFDSTEPNSGRYQQATDNIWNGNWFKNDEKYSYGFNISINLKTGHIVNLSMSKYENGGIMPMESGKGTATTGIATPVEPNTNPVIDPAQKPEIAQSSPAQEPAVIAPDYIQKPVNENINWVDGKKKAIEFIKEMLPETYGFYADSNNEQPDYSSEAMKYAREHTYVFFRVVNGIAYRDNSISVSVNRETGEVSNMYYSWSDLDFRSPNGVIGADSAENKYFGDMEARLSYQVITSYDYNNGTVTDVKPVLVYNFSSKSGPYALNQYVDAFTGEFVGNNYMLMRDAVQGSYGK